MRRLQKTYAVLVVVQFAVNHECEFDVRRDRGDRAMLVDKILRRQRIV
jgi:hypothetical protein